MAYPRTSYEALHQETREYSLLATPTNRPPAGPSRWALLVAAIAGHRAALAAWTARCARRAKAPQPSAGLHPRTR